MKNCLIALIFTMLSLSTSFASELPSLEEGMKNLTVPENELPVSASTEKIYSIQDRFAPLSLRHEIGFGVSKGFNDENFVVSKQISGSYRFHLSNRWNVGLNARYVFNSLSDAGLRLIDHDQIYPDIAYMRSLADVTVGFNLFYGKFRLSMDRVFYFDQYIALGAGIANLDTGKQGVAVGDIGFVFWLGKWGSLRLGLKDYYYNEKRRLSQGRVHNAMGYFDFGILLGGGQST